MAIIVNHPTLGAARRQRGHALMEAGCRPSLAVAIAAPFLLGLGLWGMTDAMVVTQHALLGFVAQPPVAG